MTLAPLSPVPRLGTPPNGGRPRSPDFPPGWRWDEPLEYTPEGFLLPAPVKRSPLKCVYLVVHNAALALWKRITEWWP